MKDVILNRVFEFFQASGDFNGILLWQIPDVVKTEPAKVRDAVAQLAVQRGFR
jgi:hypothetical protein